MESSGPLLYNTSYIFFYQKNEQKNLPLIEFQEKSTISYSHRETRSLRACGKKYSEKTSVSSVVLVYEYFYQDREEKSIEIPGKKRNKLFTS
jgi:hypothetical protein